MTTSTISMAGISQATSERIKNLSAQKDLPVSTTARNALFVGGIAGCGIIASLVAMQIIAGLFALVVAGAVGIGAFFVVKNLKHFDPLIAQKVKNTVI